jgi:hypothetical protein
VEKSVNQAVFSGFAEIAFFPAQPGTTAVRKKYTKYP